LVEDLKARLAGKVEAGELTIPASEEATVSFERGQITFGGKTYGFAAIGKVPQEIIAAGGTEAMIRAKG
jgi:hypothetical protein